jgi:putative endonuclease
MAYSLYIVACADGTLYTGIATDVQRRVSEHNGLGKNGEPAGGKTKGARYTSARRPVSLVYEATFETRSEASKEEFRIKQLTRAEKDVLIADATKRTAKKR